MPKQSPELPRDLVKARNRIDAWRTSNGRRRMIPEKFWLEAADLAGVHGVNRVSDAMRLSHDRLKIRLKTQRRKKSVSRSAQFVQLAPIDVPPSTSLDLLA